ncbi:DUF58 domain-containing protein [Microbacterium sp.]|uniref:DUF58 domain-containing protein n=1 Tax=Microbacterium sp. TaxID=51671 RepID=UPI0009284800|nr:DUF58 domain-containing protein [Microbacterium sp.]MBN9192425.1 DUF58 domain-containing protein [Microbacterium sp.]OJU58540.1 MAG: hypothetical protein BGO04_04315 [Microbacterium sp. 70-38]
MTASTLGSAASADRPSRWTDAAARVGTATARGIRAGAGVIRPAAWVLIVAAAVLWAGGESLGWWELTVAAVVLTVILVLCALLLIGRTAYDVTLDLNRTRVVVGERAVGALTLANTGRRAILPSRVVLPVGSGRGVFAVQRLAPGAAVEELFAIPTSRRGVLAVGPVSVVRGDPLGLFERVHHRDEPVDLFVHPRTVLFEGQSLGFLRDLEGLPATDLSRDDVSFHALREYVPGDDLRHVHWRSTARTGDIMVRQYEETRRSHFVIGLSRNPDDYRDPEEFELAISIAGSLGLRALRDSRRVDVRVQGRALPAATGKQFLDSLAGLDSVRPRDGRIEDLAGTVAATLPLASIVVLVCGSTVDAARLRVACARLPFGARVLAISTRVGAAPTLRRIAEASVVTVGDLAQLPAALRKVLS